MRPEHITFSDKAPYRGEVLATEYLGTTQIVTLSTPNGDLKVRTTASGKIKVGEKMGLNFDLRTITIFNAENGKALLSNANQGVFNRG